MKTGGWHGNSMGKGHEALKELTEDRPKLKGSTTDAGGKGAKADGAAKGSMGGGVKNPYDEK